MKGVWAWTIISLDLAAGMILMAAAVKSLVNGEAAHAAGFAALGSIAFDGFYDRLIKKLGVPG